MNSGYRVPPAHVCTWEAYSRYLQDDVNLIHSLRKELAEKIDLSKLYAVRSSANIEDSQEQSFAGQFKTVLNVQGESDLLQAIWSIWATTQSPRVLSYLEKIHVTPGELKMAVIIQEMVYPLVSGVVFSKNPTTGGDEIVVEAVFGSGEALVQEGTTPFRWIYKRHAWTLQPEKEEIERSLIQEVVDQTRSVARKIGENIDLEWVYDGKDLHWVQLREITGLKRVQLYSNTISKDMLPGMIKPLVWSVNVPMVAQAWVDLLTEAIGKNDLEPTSLVKAFYYRTYFNMGAFGEVFNRLGLPNETLEMMTDLVPANQKRMGFKPNSKLFLLMPRILVFMADKANFASKIERFLPVMEAKYHAFPINDAPHLSEHELIAEVEKLFSLTRETAYYNIVGPLLMFLYNQILRRQLKPAGVDFNSLDLQHGMEEIKRYNPGLHLSRLHNLFQNLENATQQEIQDGSYEEFQHKPGIDEFRDAFNKFIGQFGHLSDSGNDFSVMPWREQPDFMLKMVAEYTPLEQKTTEKVHFENIHLPLMKRWMVRKIYLRARQFSLYREHISSLYTYGYGLFRIYFLALGDQFVMRGVIHAREDIFFISDQEMRKIINNLSPQEDFAALIEQRKREMEQYKNLIPPNTIYGDQVPAIDQRPGLRLTGTPTSRGYYTGRVKVVCGLGDFPKLQLGDVLVVPYTDVGWTPLFSKAGGVISESGGMLSHSSIIAREYNIPAVVSVANATVLLHDQALVTVNGYNGEVIMHELPEET